MQVYGRKLYVTLYDHPIHYHIPTKQKCLSTFSLTESGCQLNGKYGDSIWATTANTDDALRNIHTLMQIEHKQWLYLKFPNLAGQRRKQDGCVGLIESVTSLLPVMSICSLVGPTDETVGHMVSSFLPCDKFYQMTLSRVQHLWALVIPFLPSDKALADDAFQGPAFLGPGHPTRFWQMSLSRAHPLWALVTSCLMAVRNPCGLKKPVIQNTCTIVDL